MDVSKQVEHITNEISELVDGQFSDVAPLSLSELVSRRIRDLLPRPAI